MTIYEIDNWTHQIKRIEVLRETDHCYFTAGYRGKEDRRRKNPSLHHTTYADARAAIIKREESEVSRCRYQLETAERHLEQARLMPEEEPAEAVRP